MLISELKNKKIIILGFAREGRDTFLALRKLFPDKTLAIADAKKIKIRRDKNTEVFFGKDHLKAIGKYNLIFKSPGIPSDLIKPFLSRGSAITSQTEIFFDNFKGKIIGVSGTKGKGTTSALIYEILKRAKLKVHLAGNIGRPVFEKLLKSKPNDIFVYELSSHQLQGLKKSPQIAVFLNLFPDHLDYYRNFQTYKKAKESLAKYQKKEDWFLYNSQDKTASEFAKKSKGGKIAFDKIKLDIKTRLKGNFNLLNIKAAFCVAKLLDLPEGKIKRAIADFKGLEHRLEFAGKHKAVEFYNDSMSTLPEAAIAALNGLPETETILVGGSDKGSDYRKMTSAIAKSKVKNVIVLGRGTGDKIIQGLPKRISVFKASDMEQAVKLCFEHTKKGVCLLSPGSASFNLFSSYEHRGELFKKYVKIFSKKTA